MTEQRVRPIQSAEAPQMLAIINAAAEAYHGEIPDDCWHEPYMSAGELQAELDAGVTFSGIHIEDKLVALMGVQPVRNVHLIRHAYVLPERQGMGLGGHLIEQLCRDVTGQILVGTWAAARWAIRFYEAHGFKLLSDEITPAVLGTYWTIPQRQVVTSVVLARPALADDEARAVIQEASSASSIAPSQRLRA